MAESEPTPVKTQLRRYSNKFKYDVVPFNRSRIRIRAHSFVPTHIHLYIRTFIRIHIQSYSRTFVRIRAHSFSCHSNKMPDITRKCTQGGGLAERGGPAGARRARGGGPAERGGGLLGGGGPPRGNRVYSESSTVMQNIIVEALREFILWDKRPDKRVL